jgi:hypothetical protein
MDLIKASEQIKPEAKVYFWNGDMEEVQEVRNALWDHWQVCDGKPVIHAVPVNMHPDPRCVDRRYLTIDPDNWEAPPKRKKLDSSTG